MALVDGAECLQPRGRDRSGLTHAFERSIRQAGLECRSSVLVETQIRGALGELPEQVLSDLTQQLLDAGVVRCRFGGWALCEQRNAANSGERRETLKDSATVDGHAHANLEPEGGRMLAAIGRSRE